MPIANLGKDLAYVDRNAIAPSTAGQVADVIQEAGGRPIDAGIIGGPPSGLKMWLRRFDQGHVCVDAGTADCGQETGAL